MGDTTQTFQVLDENKDIRLDVFLSEKMSISRSQAKKYIDEGDVSVNDKKPKKAGDIIREGDNIIVNQATKQSRNQALLDREAIPDIEVIDETSDYIVVNKPAGLLVHPTQAHEPITLITWLLKHYPEVNNVGDKPEERPGIVHRLDKDASGLLIIARNQKSFEYLKQQFKDRTINKYYRVLVYGTFEKKHDMIDFEIDRGAEGRMVSRPKTDKLNVQKVAFIQEGKEALTEYWVEDEFVRFSLLKVKIHTGRTHQIRVHMFALGHPVVGDPLYKNKKLVKKSDEGLDRLFLHARELSFIDMRGEKKSYVAELPAELQEYLKRVK